MFDQDLLLCGRCGGRLRVRAVIVDPEVAGQILMSLSRHADERGVVVLDAAWYAELGVLWAKNTGGLVRQGGGNIREIVRVDGGAHLG